MANDLPQYPLPNPGLPLGQQAVPMVAQTNPLMSAASGINTGAQLGLQAQQQKLQQAQLAAQIKQQQAAIMNQTLTTAHSYFDSLAKVDPDMAVDFYHQKIAPLQDAFWNQHGVSMDSTQIPPSHNNADTLEKANKLTQNAINDPSQIGASLAGMSYLNNQMNIGEMTQQRLAANTKTLEDIKSAQQFQQTQTFEQQKHIDQAEQEYASSINAMKGRSGGFGLQDQKVDQAIHLRQMINQSYDPQTGNYNVKAGNYPELVMGLANLMSPTGTADAETRKNLESMTASGKLNQAIQYITGQPQVGNTQAVIKSLVDSIDRQGQTSQTLRDNYVSQVQPPSILPPDRAARIFNQGRGSNYVDYLPGGVQSKLGPIPANTPSFNSEAQAMAANLPKGSIVMINGRRARID
jgi:hypothetical protein